VQGTGLTGAARTRKPVYTDLLPPCNAGCPAGENIQAWLAAVRDGEFERAWRLLTDDNPFPAIHSRVGADRGDDGVLHPSRFADGSGRR
jgi:formate dehydrogenase (NADP+) beta subunit